MPSGARIGLRARPYSPSSTRTGPSCCTSEGATYWLSAEPIHAGQLAVFEESGSDSIETQADGDTSFVIGSAVEHPHPLVLGRYSVHTSANPLAQGEAEIRRIGDQLRAEGRR